MSAYWTLEAQILSSTSRQVFHPKESEDLDGDSLQSSHAAKRWEESRLAVSWMNVSGDVWGSHRNGWLHYVTLPQKMIVVQLCSLPASTRQAMLNAKILAETAATSEPPETHEFSQGGMGRCSTWDTRYPTKVCLHPLALSLVISFMFCVPWRQYMMKVDWVLQFNILRFSIDAKQQGEIPVQWTWFSLQNICQRKL